MPEVKITRSNLRVVNAISKISTSGAAFTTGNTISDRVQVSGPDTITISEGAYAVDVQNIGVSGDITVNGDTVGPGGEWHAQYGIDYADNRQDFVEEVNIVVPSGSVAWYRVIRPAS